MNDRELIQEIHKQWLDLEISGNGRAVTDLCSNDVLWLVPGSGGIRGRQAIMNWLDCQPSVGIERIEIVRMEIEVSNTLAIKTADFTTHLRVPEGTPLNQISGTHLWTLRKELESDRWLVTSVSWSISVTCILQVMSLILTCKLQFNK